METESFLDLEADWKDRVIIAMKGLPCNGKTLVAALIGNWAKRPVLYIDDFIGALDNDIASDSWEEAERLQVSVLQQAFTTLCRVAHSHIRSEFQCVVIKSRLASAFELDQLFRLVRSTPDIWTLLIVECQVIRNKHQWQERFNNAYASYEKKWYRPRRWNDIEKAIDDHFDPQALAHWDLHLQHLIQQYDDPILVRRLVVDPFYDVEVEALMETSDINPIFAHAINHLLSAKPEELNHQNPYVVKFDEFRRSRAEDVVNASTSSERSEDICGYDGCLFKYWEELRVDEDDDEDSCDVEDDDDDEGSCCCGVCGEKVVSGQPGYTCHYCILTLHKSCAEMIHFDSRSIRIEYKDLLDYIPQLPASEKHACDSHLQEFREYCSYCCFQTVGRLVPLVVNHDHHPHPLSLRIRKKGFFCKACGVFEYSSSYVCRICEWYYHIQCLFMPGEWKHGHGGHEHVLKLKYSQDDMEQEDYWCDVCFEDLDPYCWFYSCQSCPYYAAHLYCFGVYPRHLWSLGSI